MAKILYYLLFLLATSFPAFAQTVAPQTPNSQETFPEFPFPEEEVRGDDGHFTSQLLQMFLMLGLLLALLLLTSWYLKRMMNSRIQQVNADSPIKVLEQRAVSARTTVYALDIEGKTYIFAETANSVTSLHPIPEDPKGK